MYFRKYDLGAEDSVDATAFAYYEKRKPQTNYDRLISKTPEELAEFIEYLTSGCDYMYPKCYASEFCTSGVCRSAWLDWLKSPAEVENG